VRDGDFLLGKNADLIIVSDMNHSNMYAVGLALCTFANISSEEMSRDLCNEIEKLLGSSNTYIRKKVSFSYLAKDSVGLTYQAALCALRVIRRVPDLMDHFTNKAKSLLQDRNHGVLLTGITLVTEMCELDESICDEFRKVRSSHIILLPSLTLYRRLDFW
jgi:AP-1 complex subunit gamma-1